MVYETIIIGAGMAGMTAAIYASRRRMDFLVLSKDVGGQFAISGEIENYPGFKRIDSLNFLARMKEQLKYNDIEVQNESVVGIENKGDDFVVRTRDNDYMTKTVIIATGGRPRKLGVPGEDEFAKKGLTYCALCDGPLFKGKDVAVIGGGDSALEAVDFLLRIARKVYVVNLTEDLTGQQYLIDRVVGNQKVEIINNARTTEILGDKFVRGLRYKVNSEIKELKCEGIFVEVGRYPNSELVKDIVDMDNHDHIRISKFCETSIKGIFAAGDVTDMNHYQYVIAAGQGSVALLSAARYIK